MIVLYILSYLFMASCTFVLTAYVANTLDSPWQDPGPFFAGLAWPLAMAFILATVICHRIEDRDGKTRLERKQNKEIEKAKHEQRLATIQAETLAIKEKEAGLR